MQTSSRLSEYATIFAAITIFVGIAMACGSLNTTVAAHETRLSAVESKQQSMLEKIAHIDQKTDDIWHDLGHHD